MATDLSAPREPEQPNVDADRPSFAGQPDAADLFMRLLTACLPARTYGDLRHLRGGYHRMVAMAYRIAPEVFEGMTEREVAKRLGVKLRVFMYHLTEADDILARRRAARPRK